MTRPFARLALGALLASSATACLEDPAAPTLSARQFCEERARIDCHVFYDCYSEDMRARVRLKTPIGTTKQECQATLPSTCAATPYACPVDRIFQLQIAGACVRALDAVKCDNWLRDDAASVPACEHLCIDNPA